MSACKPSMYITIERHRYDYAVKATVYELQIGIQKNEDEVLVHKLITRYSVLDQFDKQLRIMIGDDINLPAFPPKRYLWNNDPSFVQEREKGLKLFLEGITKIPGILQIPYVQDFFAISELNSEK
ncbi:PX domain containing protein [Tritrichomonas foetus]|uniref:PX domain containing protein n=1 Tax=Tritrichomonas foetus TaxID=1144522 RepID=A0A1J4L165_9EUKA|nr:PX domain containing protein [Tritrichomonas foetus]|eukprot:OHT17257.1 PX domain containing protein [Tritrichomonas foetus]